jgi:peptide/nickel transport system permease protein
MTQIAAAEAAVIATKPQGLWTQTAIRFFRTQPLGTAGLAVVLLFIFMALFAPLLAPHDPLKINYGDIIAPPSATYWMGTDSFGRDAFSRLIYGSRTAMLVGLVSAFIGATLGLVIGVWSAYFGGRMDMVIQRILDVFMSFPLIILALAIVAALGSGTANVIMAITITMVPRCARVIRSSAMPLREVPFVDAARALGFSHMRIMFRHMMPNVMAPYLIMLTAFMGQAILLEASLSFLGLGVQEPTPAWGLMLQGAAELYAETAPWLPLFPGLAITISVFAFNMFGDSLRDVLDPKLRI